MSTWAYIIIGIVALIVLCIIVHFVYRHYRIKYGLNLYAGGFGMLIAVACVAGFVLLMKSTPFAYALLIVGIAFFLWVAVISFKHCGAAGIIAILLEILFCLPCLLMAWDVVSRKGNTSTYVHPGRDAKYERERDKYINRKLSGRTYDPANDPRYNGGVNINDYDDEDVPPRRRR